MQGARASPASTALAMGEQPGPARKEATTVGSGLGDPEGRDGPWGTPEAPAAAAVGAGESGGREGGGRHAGGAGRGGPGGVCPHGARPLPSAPRACQGPRASEGGEVVLRGTVASVTSRVDLGSWVPGRSRAHPAPASDPRPQRRVWVPSSARGVPCGLAGSLASPQPERVQSGPRRRREGGEAECVRLELPESPVTGVCRRLSNSWGSCRACPRAGLDGDPCLQPGPD